ncbi:GIY-YIG nuclease family protein [Oculatella sp. LEGE 06141]|uniref:GIY-YIG nuclease family protein n=1 Tax=Oculatella sp. LEGE 06141 TaxID=1828648 RepID=UPI00188147EB|nr:GIY-YIG nuclease family protein [Oculatella sp. LEGE 06141]MBE9181492.1 GIY-YIG nuclease family protein [Oculatella sp. LEGE 06141]
MTSDTSTPTLAELDYIPYLDEQGQLTDQFDGKVGVYAIFDQAEQLRYIGYSRDVSLSLKQHLVRQPRHCHWVKVQTIARPSRTQLEAMRDSWIAENGCTPVGNAADEPLWNQAIDAKTKMTAAEQAEYAASDDLGKIKTLKRVARRVEAEVLADLEARGVTMPVRFDPKLKEEGLLNLK